MPCIEDRIRDARSPVQEFYAGSTVFLTGATGFFGKIIIDKLLRLASDLDAIYIMVRSKKGKTVEQRTEELFDDPVFGRLKEEVPDFRRKVVAVAGDCREPQFGLEQNDLDAIISKTNVVFHAAATVKFDEKINIAMSINVKGVSTLLDICKKCVCLKSVVYVSTAFAHCHHFDIEEKFYPPIREAEKLVAFVENQTEKRLESMTPKILGPYPNTYAFTKALAEDVIRVKCADVPIAVFRPSIVVGTSREPIPGWIDNMYGPTGVVLATGAGLLRAMCADHDSVADIVPVDLVCNAIIATAWKTARDGRRGAPAVTNFVSSTRNPITWGQFLFWNMTFGQAFPTVHALWYYTLTMTPHRSLYLLYSAFVHFLPALLADLALLLVGRKPRLVSTYRKIHRFLEVIAYFSTQQWSFQDASVDELWGQLDPRDRQLLDFRLEKLEWDRFFLDNIKTMRWCLMNDQPDTLPRARARMARLRLLHHSIKYAIIGALIWIAYSLFRRSFLPLATVGSRF